jgi:hypothetical protein
MGMVMGHGEEWGEGGFWTVAWEEIEELIVSMGMA